MKNISNNPVSQKLKDFDELELIVPSSEWNQLLLNKLAGVKQHSHSAFLTTKMIVAVTLIIIVNIGFIVKITNSRDQQIQTKQSISYQSNNRDTDLQMLSKELLINSISTND
ncbi:MAG: hypothetical protein HYZ42_04815 [Bacteroidetes bacterium]|nr:hypothetical protein [Bacteroidota bacterium]